MGQPSHGRGRRAAPAAGDKVVDTRSVDPPRQGTPLVATGLDGPGTVIDVWRLTVELPVLVERWALPATLMPWREGDPVPWVDPEIIAAVYTAIARTHFSEVLGLRVGHRWRTEREPAGWPFLTRYAVPKLYDYLRPPTTMCAGTLTGFWRRARGISRLPFAKTSSIS